jgi:hypothetical protein
VPKGELPLFAGDLDGEGIVEPAVTPAPQMTEGEEVVEDYVAMRRPIAWRRRRGAPMTLAGRPGRPHGIV